MTKCILYMFIYTSDFNSYLVCHLENVPRNESYNWLIIIMASSPTTWILRVKPTNVNIEGGAYIGELWALESGDVNSSSHTQGSVNPFGNPKLQEKVTVPNAEIHLFTQQYIKQEGCKSRFHFWNLPLHSPESGAKDGHGQIITRQWGEDKKRGQSKEWRLSPERVFESVWGSQDKWYLNGNSDWNLQEAGL